MIEQDRYCIDIITQVSALQAALDNVALELVSDHVRHCVLNGDENQRLDRADELVDTIKRLIR